MLTKRLDYRIKVASTSRRSTSPVVLVVALIHTMEKYFTFIVKGCKELSS